MQEDPLTNAASDSDAALGSLTAARGRLVDAMLVLTALLSLPSVLASVYRVAQTGWRNIVLAHLAVPVLFVLVALLRRRLPFTFRASVLLAAFFVPGCVSLLRSGIIGLGPVSLVVFAVLAAHLLGTRAGIVAIAVNLVTMSGVGYGVLHGLVSFDFDIGAYAVARPSWSVAVLVSTFLTAVIVASASRLHAGFVSSVLSLSRKSAQLQEVNTNLRQEIAARTRAELARHGSEARYRTLFEGGADGVLIVRDSRFVECNKRALELYGATSKDLLGSTPVDFSPPSQPDGRSSDEKAAEVIAAALAGSRQQFDWRHQRLDGTTFEAEVTLNRLELDGKLCLQAHVRDMSESRRTEAALQSVFRAAPIGIGLVVDRAFTQVNEHLCQMLGYSRAELIGMDAEVLFLTREEYEHVGSRYALAGEVESAPVEVCWKAKDGRVLDVLLTGAPLDPAERSAGLTFAALDITERNRAERALRESDRRYRELIERTDSLVTQVDGEGRYVFLNDAAARVIGVSPAQLVGRQAIDFLHPEDRPHASAVFEQCAREGETSVSYEGRQLNETGGVHHVLWNVTLQYDEADRILLVNSIGRDITEQKRAEKALRESEDRYRSLVENATDGVAIIQDGLLRFCNARMAEMIGFAVEEMIDTPFLDYVHPDERPRMLETYRARLRGEAVPSMYEFRGCRRDGSCIDLETSPGIITLDGRPATLSFIRDVSERKRAEATLREHEETIRALVETSQDWIWAIDLNGVHTYCNPAVEAILGYAPEELVGKSSLDLMHGEDREVIESRLPDWIARKRSWSNVAIRWRHKDGSWRYLESSAVPKLDPAGEVTGFRGVDRDVTERKQTEEAAERQREELARADKMIALGTLVSGVAHEINNPNHFMLLNLPILRAAWKDIQPLLDRYSRDDPDLQLANLPYEEMRQEIPQLIEEVLQGAERIKFIVSELRGYARPHSASKGSVALNEVVRSAVALIANTVNKKTSRFSVSYGKELPRIRGNLRRLEQVVLNLILNACQALESRDRAVRVRTSQDPDAGRVIVTVEDEGRGIPEADLGRILNPFYTTRRDDGGTGLGLAVAARIVDEHHGELSYESEPGSGTLARLSLPVYRREEA